MTITEPVVPEPKESKIRSLAKRLWKRYRALLPLDFWLVTVLLSAGLVFFASRIWISLASGGYVVPKDAADWGAWGTWIGGLATAAAFIYTAFQLRDQRANRTEDEAKAFAAMKAKAYLVGASIGSTRTTRYYVSHPTENLEMNSTLLGVSLTLGVFNEGDAVIQNVRVGLTRSFALPPLSSATQPIWAKGPNKHEVMDSGFNVPSFSTGVTPTPASTGFGQGVHFQIVQSIVPTTCDLVFEDVGEKPSVAWIVFTDSSGYTWHRDLLSGALSHQPDHQN